jgi:hypothetical protein
VSNPGPAGGEHPLRVFFREPLKLFKTMTRYSNLALLSMYFLAGLCIGAYVYDLKVRTCMNIHYAANWYCRL